jgi:hypothetical protein
MRDHACSTFAAGANCVVVLRLERLAAGNRINLAVYGELLTILKQRTLQRVYRTFPRSVASNSTKSLTIVWRHARGCP